MQVNLTKKEIEELLVLLKGYIDYFGVDKLFPTNNSAYKKLVKALDK